MTNIVTYLERYQLTHVFDASLRKAMHIQTFAPGETLCRQGDVAHELYLLVEGKLKITHMSATGNVSCCPSSIRLISSAILSSSERLI